MKIEEVTAPPVPTVVSAGLPSPQPPVREPVLDDVEYLAWRQELL